MNPQHVLAAKIATVAVSDAMPYGPANIPLHEAWAGAEERVESLQSKMTRFQMKHGITSREAFQEKKGAYFAKLAKQALAHRAGNCDAMSALAYRILVNSPSIRPVALHSFQNPGKTDAHAFVTINQVARDAKMVAWSADDVVICDPWLSHIHIHYADVLVEKFDEDELMGVYSVARHMRFMEKLGYYGGSEVEMLRVDS